MLADDGAGVEVGELEVGVLRTELVAQLVSGGIGEVAHLAQEPAGLPGQGGKTFGPHHQDGDEEDHRQF